MLARHRGQNICELGSAGAIKAAVLPFAGRGKTASYQYPSSLAPSSQRPVAARSALKGGRQQAQTVVRGVHWNPFKTLAVKPAETPLAFCGCCRFLRGNGVCTYCWPHYSELKRSRKIGAWRENQNKLRAEAGSVELDALGWAADTWVGESLRMAWDED